MSHQPATLHLVSGLPGSGKTTYAEALRADTGAVLFSLDRWLITAYGQYALAQVGQEEHTRRVLACRDLIWGAAAELLRRATDVILDDGFFLREHRRRYVAMAAAIGASAVIHHVHAPLDVVLRRLERRNRHLPPHNFYIDPDVLTGFIGLYEVPSSEEGAAIVAADMSDERQPRVDVQ
jgi:predicted kinase